MSNMDAPQASQTSLSSQLPFAAQPDIVCAVQKDAAFLHSIRTSISECVLRIAGNRVQVRYDNEIDAAARLLYYGLTTLAGLQTLGEEYCDVLQVSALSLTPPGLLQRAALVAMQTVVPYALSQQILPLLAQHKGQWQTWAATILRSAQQTVFPVHLMVFYFFGAYYHLSKRLAGIRYMFGRELREGEQRPGYQLLGALLAVQLAFQGWAWYRARRESADEDAEVTKPAGAEVHTTGDADAGPALSAEADWGTIPNCMLCMSPCDHTTAAPCGHLFCWTCVCTWVNEKPECPFCRRPIQVKQLVPLYHYAE